MKTFEIKYYAYAKIKARTSEEALQGFQQQNPTAKVQYVADPETGTTDEVIGYCEISGRPIFEFDDYAEDGEGIMWLKKFEKPD